VGLIFAGIGLTLMVDGRRILDEAVFTAILIIQYDEPFVIDSGDAD
jgi:hypothetical protein